MTHGRLTLRGTGTRRVTTIPEICILAQSSRRAAECLLADPPRNTALQARFVYRCMAVQIRVVCIGVSDVTIGIKHQALSPVTAACAMCVYELATNILLRTTLLHAQMRWRI